MSDHRHPEYADLIFENVPYAIFTVSGEGQITSFNRAAEEVTGWRKKEAMGSRCSEVLRSNHCEHDCFLINSMQAGEVHRDKEVMIQRKDGTQVPIAVSTAALRDESGMVVGGVEMFRDLSGLEALRRQLDGAYTCDNIVTKSSAMRSVRELLPLVAKSTSTVLIEGEPGTGKELVARAIHNLGSRRAAPFVATNCAAIPDTLVESELFGHVRGAFTDAKHDKPGRFAAAEGGTLVLDEIGEISPAVQVKLLRVLVEREFTPLGAFRPVKADVRILAATNRDLALEVMNGRFRQDLFFRLNVVRMVLPPLRSRKEDIPLLVQSFIARFNELQGRRMTSISQRAMACLLEYSFPGNVRELENAIEHAFVVCPGSTIRLEDLPPHVRGESVLAAITNETTARPLDSAEAAALREALARNSGNRNRTAEDLGISRNTLWRKMKKHGLLKSASTRDLSPAG